MQAKITAESSFPNNWSLEMLRRVLALLDAVTADEMRNNWKNLIEFAERS